MTGAGEELLTEEEAEAPEKKELKKPKAPPKPGQQELLFDDAKGGVR